MAKLTREDVLKLANLDKLELSDKEVEEFQKEISEVLGYVEQLQEVDLDGLKPTYQVTGLKNITRPDEIKDYGTDRNNLLKNVPAVESGQIKVKRILG